MSNEKQNHRYWIEYSQASQSQFGAICTDDPHIFGGIYYGPESRHDVIAHFRAWADAHHIDLGELPAQTVPRAAVYARHHRADKERLSMHASVT